MDVSNPNGRHFGRVYSGLIRRLKIKQFRERITLRDDDFIDLDWSYKNDLFHHIGVAQILESYTLTTLVDYFGDVPYSQGLQGDSCIGSFS